METNPGSKLNAAELKRLAIRRDAPGARRAIGHLGSIACSGALLWTLRGTAWAVPLLCLHGYMVAFLFNMLHETAHQTAFRSRAANRALGHLAGFVIFLPYEYYRAFHWDHHRHTQDPEKDPELALPLPRTTLGVLWLWSGAPTWIGRVRLLLKHAVSGRVTVPWVAEAKRGQIVGEARAYLAGYAIVAVLSLLTGSWAAAWLWLAPLAVGQWFLRPYLLSEHTGCANEGSMLETTRTTYTNRFVHFFAWNMPYHAEHHAYPAVPFHSLPQLNERLAGHLKETANGYPLAMAAVLRHLLSADSLPGRSLGRGRTGLAPGAEVEASRSNRS